MKFSCERCGKKYATAETPASGRVYKIKCKACGHLIVVKASGGAASATTQMRPATSTGLPAQHDAATPELHLEIAPPEPAAPPAGYELPPLPGLEPEPVNGAHGGLPHLPEATQEISVSSFSVSQTTTPRAIVAPPPPPPPPPHPQESGYVDIFAEPAKPEPPPRPRDDPFLAAARASLPEGYGKSGHAPDPFAGLEEELKTPPPEPIAPAPSPPAPKSHSIAKPPAQKNNVPIILIGAGALVLVGILAFVLLGGKKAPPAAAPPLAQVQQPASPAPAPAQAAPVPAPAPAAQPSPPPAPVAAAPAKPEKRTSPDEDRRAREDKRQRERDAKEAAARDAKDAREREKAARERDKAAREARAREDREAKDRDRATREARAREDREAKERDRAAREARARDERDAKDRERQRREQEKVASASMAEPVAEGLTQDQIQRVLSATRRAFESCIVTSGKSGEVQLDGRRVLLRLNIQTNGAVTYPTLDDVSLNGTELGSCLKSAARTMVFPKFGGDTMHVEVPLVLAGGR